MATKKSNGKGKGNSEAQVVFPIGTRHETVRPSLATLTRMPVALPMGKAKAQADLKGEFLLSLLEQAGKDGITWAEMQQALKEKFGAAPKKRHSLYAILHGRQWYKLTGQRGIVTYHLGREPKKRGSKQA